jgi:hypothetical protein
MSRLLRFAAVAAALVLLTGTGCEKKNSAPEPPQIQGPTSARPADTLTYRFTSTDPDGDSVFFMISWRDGDSTQWSPATPSDTEYIQTYTYPDSGTYFIKAKAKDSKDAESDWSDSVRVRIGSFPPNAPSRPTGPTACSTGLAYAWSTKALHPLQDSVAIQFSWGNGEIDSFARMVASNHLFDTTHTYSVPGTYKIAARARDASGLESPWSETLVVIVDTAHGIPGNAPRNLVLRAVSDSTVGIAWSAPLDSTPDRYVVLFRWTGTSSYDSIGDTTGLGYIHDPMHKTGQYKVAAVYDTTHVQSSETPSTAPIASSSQWVPELNGTGYAGYGWDRTSGESYLYDMKVLDSLDKVDLYITDFAPGFAGPNYQVASPDTAPLDPGGGVPSGFWNLTMFTRLDSLAGEDSILPRFSTSRYRKASPVDRDSLVACYTHDNHYALLRVVAVDTIVGRADVETWFQLIPGLRLIEHN